MLPITDFRCDESDDIIISDGDILIEDDFTVSTIKTGERRASARVDDFPLNNAGAGIEKYLRHGIKKNKENIIEDLRRTLTDDSLFDDNDISIVIPTEDKDLQIFVKIKCSSSASDGFRVYIDKLNQQAYR